LILSGIWGQLQSAQSPRMPIWAFAAMAGRVRQKIGDGLEEIA